MLARRVVTRPTTTIRRLGGFQLQRRFLHPSGSQLQTLPRPNTWLAKLRFRADGKPRSKLIAFGFGSLILTSLLISITIIGTTVYNDKIGDRLVKLIYVQQTDTSYDSVDFDDPISTLSYFKKLYLSFALSVKPEQADHNFNELMKHFKKMKTGGGSEKSPEIQAHHIMRLAAEKIHGAIQELNQDSIVTTAEFVMLVWIEAVDSLLELTHDNDNDDGVSKFFRIINHSKKDPGVSKDYEVLG